MQTTPSDGSTSLVFLAPPVTADEAGEDHYDDLPDDGPRQAPRTARPPRREQSGDDRSASSPSGNGQPSGGSALRMLKGARQAAAGMKIGDDAIRRVLDDPQDVGPDPNQPHRTCA